MSMDVSIEATTYKAYLVIIPQNPATHFDDSLYLYLL